MTTPFSLRPKQLVDLKQYEYEVAEILGRLATRATVDVALRQLHERIHTLNEHTFNTFVNTVLQRCDHQSTSYQKHIFDVLAMLATVHKFALVPHLKRIITLLSRHVGAADTGVQDRLVDCVAVLARHVPTVSPGRHIVTMIRPLLEGMAAAPPDTQRGAARALQQVVRNYNENVLQQHAQRLITRVSKLFRLSTLAVPADYLRVLVAIVEVCGDAVLNSIPTIIRVCLWTLAHSQWQARKAAADALLTFGHVLGAAMRAFADDLRPALRDCRFDTHADVRQACAAALDFYGPGDAPPSLLETIGTSASTRVGGPMTPLDTPYRQRRAPRPYSTSYRARRRAPVRESSPTPLFEEERRSGLVGKRLQQHYEDQFMSSLRSYAHEDGENGAFADNSWLSTPRAEEAGAAAAASTRDTPDRGAHIHTHTSATVRSDTKKSAKVDRESAGVTCATAATKVPSSASQAVDDITVDRLLLDELTAMRNQQLRLLDSLQTFSADTASALEALSDRLKRQEAFARTVAQRLDNVVERVDTVDAVNIEAKEEHNANYMDIAESDSDEDEEAKAADADVPCSTHASPPRSARSTHSSPRRLPLSSRPPRSITRSSPYRSSPMRVHRFKAPTPQSASPSASGSPLLHNNPATLWKEYRSVGHLDQLPSAAVVHLLYSSLEVFEHASETIVGTEAVQLWTQALDSARIWRSLPFSLKERAKVVIDDLSHSPLPIGVKAVTLMLKWHD